MDIYDVTLQSITNNLPELKVISANVANVNTVGYLKGATFEQKIFGERVLHESVSSSQGSIKETNRALDIAILSDGFFQITFQNKQMLTKDGHFYIGKDSFLQHSSGGLVVGENGAITVQANTTHINAMGEVIVQGVVVDKLSIVKVDNINSLKRMGNNLYQTSMGFSEIEVPTLKSGALNGSNVESSNEMIRMIQVSRQLQSSQKVVNAYDQLLNVGINELGKR